MRRGEDPNEDEGWFELGTLGYATPLQLPFNLNEDEAAAVLAELRAKEKRRIPPGFQVPKKMRRKK